MFEAVNVEIHRSISLVSSSSEYFGSINLISEACCFLLSTPTRESITGSMFISTDHHLFVGTLISFMKPKEPASISLPDLTIEMLS